MTPVAAALLALAGVAAVVDWWAVARDRAPVEYGAKPATLLLLLAVAAAIHPHVPDRRPWFLAALGLSLAGDVLLMLPSDRFVAGLAAFLAGHLAYIVGLTRHGGSAGALAVAGAVMAAVATAVGRPIVRAVRRSEPAMLGPVIAYIAVIAVMVTCALATGNALAGGGAVLFLVSDASIAWDRFVRPWSWARTWIMVTYHLAQGALVLSLVR